MNYEELSLVLKALADPNRLKILEMISCEAKRACDILNFFDFSQPTLSHHMKTLTKANLVHKAKDGRWISYSINQETVNQLNIDLGTLLTNDGPTCLCHLMPESSKEKETI